MSVSIGQHSLYGLAGEYETPEAILEAARVVREAGFTAAEAYTPSSVEGLAPLLGMRRTPIAPIMGVCAIIGGTTGFGMQWFANVIHYPWNIGGRPPNSWPAFIPITFELSILFAAFGGLIAMLTLNGLPRLYHPMFRLDAFTRASRDHFFLCIESIDPAFDLTRARTTLESTHPLAILEVPR